MYKRIITTIYNEIKILKIAAVFILYSADGNLLNGAFVFIFARNCEKESEQL